MRMLLGVVLISAAVACAPKRVRYVLLSKDQPEAMKCWRECKAIEATCLTQASPRDVLGVPSRRALEDRCNDEVLDCAMTCPDAREQWRAE